MCVSLGRRRSRLTWANTFQRKARDRARLPPLGRRKIQQGPQGGSFFPYAQAFRRRVRFRQPFPVAEATGFGVLAFGFLFIDDRRETGRLVEVRDDSGQHPQHPSTVERDVFRLGIGLASQVL